MGAAFDSTQNTLANNLWSYSSFAGAICCIIALFVVGVLYVHSASRAELDRVSFRLMTWSLVSSTIFGITSGCVGMMYKPAWGCRFAVWIVILTLHISTFLLFCIALNLHLVILHNAQGENLEKWYYLGSVFLALVLTLPPLVASQYGWDDVVGACWYANRGDVSERIRWQVATQLFWSMACALGELVVFVSVFTHMIKHHMALSAAVAPERRSQHRTITHRSAIIRIALYPITSFILNSTIVACDLQSTVASSAPQTATKATYAIRLLNDFCYGGRGVVYAILAITDPSLIRAVKSLYHRIYSPWHRMDSDDIRRKLELQRISQEFHQPDVPLVARISTRAKNFFNGAETRMWREETLEELNNIGSGNLNRVSLHSSRITEGIHPLLEDTSRINGSSPPVDDFGRRI